MPELSKTQTRRIRQWLLGTSILSILVLVLDLGFNQVRLYQTALNGYYFLFALLHFVALVLIGRRAVAGRRFLALRHWAMRLLSGAQLALAVLEAASRFLPDEQVVVLIRTFVFLLAFIEISGRIYDIEQQTLHPGLVFVLSFLFLIAIGTLLLLLPRASTAGISFVDALFTATSAVCVTGLAVVDTGKDFTLFGQYIILFLIQAGALGVLTFTNLFGLFFRGYSSFRNRLMLKELINADDVGSTFSTLIKIIVFTFSIEALGAVLVYHLSEGIAVPPGGRVFFAFFHSVSAFCNAGFSTLGQSMYDAGFRYAYGVHLVLAGLFIFGGLGYSIVNNAYDYAKNWLVQHWQLWQQGRDPSRQAWRRSLPRPHISMNTKIVVVTTGGLLAFSTLAFYALEYDNTLAEHEGWGKWVTAFFGAATTRTAGFNSVDNAALRVPTLLLCLLLMWIGASPGSTGGGIKTTTFAVATLNIWQQVLGRSRLVFGWKEIPQAAVQRATAIISLSLIAVGFSTFLVMCFDEHLGMLPVAFECFSAYSTVGLSVGITAQLSTASKLVLVVTMFVGRVSFLTLLVGLVRQFVKPRYDPCQYPQEDVFIN